MKKNSMGKIPVVLLFFTLMLSNCGPGSSESNPIQDTPAQSSSERDEEAKEEAKELVIEHIKSKLRDPESFKAYRWLIKPDSIYGKITQVTVDYGARNGFGGMNRSVEVYSIMEGKVFKNN